MDIGDLGRGKKTGSDHWVVQLRRVTGPCRLNLTTMARKKARAPHETHNHLISYRDNGVTSLLRPFEVLRPLLEREPWKWC